MVVKIYDLLKGLDSRTSSVMTTKRASEDEVDSQQVIKQKKVKKTKRMKMKVQEDIPTGKKGNKQVEQFHSLA